MCHSLEIKFRVKLVMILCIRSERVNVDVGRNGLIIIISHRIFLNFLSYFIIFYNICSNFFVRNRIFLKAQQGLVAMGMEKRFWTDK